jgi:cyanophycinase
VAKRVRGGKLVLATVASHQPEGYFDDYEKAFADLASASWSSSMSRTAPRRATGRSSRVLDDAAGIFFSGGDQLRITSQIGDTGIEAKVRAFTSAAASSPAPRPARR